MNVYFVPSILLQKREWIQVEVKIKVSENLLRHLSQDLLVQVYLNAGER